jgi:uncharacterized small protein (DUF1192 family)
MPKPGKNQKALPLDGRARVRLMPGASRRALSLPVSLLAVGPGHSRQLLRMHESHCKFSSREDIPPCSEKRQIAPLPDQLPEDKMPIEDDDRPRKKITHEIGQELSLLSVEELNERIALLTTEADRLREAAAKKRASKDAASSFFKT